MLLLPSTWACRSKSYRQTAAKNFPSTSKRVAREAKVFTAIFAAKAAVRTSPRLRDELHFPEVDDHVRRADDGVVLVRRDAERALFSRARVLASTGGPDLLRRVDGSRLA